MAVGGASAAAEPPAPPARQASEPGRADLKAGKAAYEQSCARCHGVEGRGDGVDARRFYPRPRDLTMGVYKFRSTASGTPPSDEDLFRTITDGLPGSHMPDWQHLDEPTRWQLVYYLKSLSPVFEQTKSDPLAIAADPGAAHTDLAAGKAVYAQLRCGACHGVAGRANGTSAAGLVDDWGRKIRPADLTKAWNYRGGSQPRDIMLRLMAGIDGAGMPSYAGAVSPADAWQLAYYVASLQEPAHWNLVAHAAAITGPLPETLNDPRWAGVERTDVRLHNVVQSDGEWVEPPTVVSVVMQAVYNGEAVAWRLTWNDPSQDQHSAADALAVVLKPEAARGDTVTLQAWPYAGAPALDVCAWSADAGTAHEAVTTDYAAATARENAQTVLTTAAHYDDGRWQLLLQRPAHPATPERAAAISPDEFTSMAFVVWDGGNPGARAVSAWIDLVVSDGREHVHH